MLFALLHMQNTIGIDAMCGNIPSKIELLSKWTCRTKEGGAGSRHLVIQGKQRIKHTFHKILVYLPYKSPHSVLD